MAHVWLDQRMIQLEDWTLCGIAQGQVSLRLGEACEVWQSEQTKIKEKEPRCVTVKHIEILSIKLFVFEHPKHSWLIGWLMSCPMMGPWTMTLTAQDVHRIDLLWGQIARVPSQQWIFPACWQVIPPLPALLWLTDAAWRSALESEQTSQGRDLREATGFHQDFTYPSGLCRGPLVSAWFVGLYTCTSWVCVFSLVDLFMVTWTVPFEYSERSSFSLFG